MTANDVFATAQQQVCAYLRSGILSGELPCNASLDPALIARELGISRMPVREALRQLGAEGLVTLRPNRMAIVTNLTLSEVEDLFDVRAAIEAIAIRSAIPAMNAAAISELRLLAGRMNSVADDLKLWIQRHEEFHQFISDLSGRPRLSKEILRLSHAVQPYLLISMKSSGKTEIEGSEHDTLIDIFETGSVAASEAAMLEHINKSKLIAIDGLSMNPPAERTESFARVRNNKVRLRAAIAQSELA